MSPSPHRALTTKYSSNYTDNLFPPFRYANDPEYKAKIDKQTLADKLAKEKAKEAKGKKGKKGKKAGKGGKGAPKPQKMSKKEEAAFEAKEASRVKN